MPAIYLHILTDKIFSIRPKTWAVPNFLAILIFNDLAMITNAAGSKRISGQN